MSDTVAGTVPAQPVPGAYPFASVPPLLDPTDLVRPGVEQSILSLNAEVAKFIVDCCMAPNRGLDQGAVSRYRRDIEEGTWAFTADPLRFDVTGKLIDGQHRVHAVAGLSDPSETIPFAIVLGLPPESIMAMDQGRKRTAATQFSLRGQKHSSLVAAAARVVMAWDEMVAEGSITPSRLDSSQYSVPMLERWADANRDVIDHVVEHGSLFPQTGATGSAAMAAGIVMARLDPDAELEFFTTLVEGGEPKGSPILALDKRLQKLSRGSSRYRSSHYMALFFRAWNAWRQGSQVTQLKGIAAGKPFPRPTKDGQA